TREESGYFSPCEGKNAKVYVACAAHGRTSYLGEFEPKTEKMRIGRDTDKLAGLPLDPTGYAAQSKLRPRTFVGPSGKSYAGAPPNTLIGRMGRDTAITRDYQVARYDPAKGKVTIDPLVVDGKPFQAVIGPEVVHPDWRMAADGSTAYLQLLNGLRMFEVDLG